MIRFYGGENSYRALENVSFSFPSSDRGADSTSNAIASSLFWLTDQELANALFSRPTTFGSGADWEVSGTDTSSLLRLMDQSLENALFSSPISDSGANSLSSSLGQVS